MDVQDATKAIDQLLKNGRRNHAIMKSNELKLSKKQPYSFEVLEQQIRNEVSADAPQGWKLAELALEQQDFERQINMSEYPPSKRRSPKRQTMTHQSKSMAQNTLPSPNVSQNTIVLQRLKQPNHKEYKDQEIAGRKTNGTFRKTTIQNSHQMTTPGSKKVPTDQVSRNFAPRLSKGSSLDDTRYDLETPRYGGQNSVFYKSTLYQRPTNRQSENNQDYQVSFEPQDQSMSLQSSQIQVAAIGIASSARINSRNENLHQHAGTQPSRQQTRESSQSKRKLNIAGSQPGTLKVMPGGLSRDCLTQRSHQYIKNITTASISHDILPIQSWAQDQQSQFPIPEVQNRPLIPSKTSSIPSKTPLDRQMALVQDYDFKQTNDYDPNSYVLERKRASSRTLDPGCLPEIKTQRIGQPKPRIQKDLRQMSYDRQIRSAQGMDTVMQSRNLSRSRHQRSMQGEDSSRTSSLLTKQKGAADLIKSLQEQAAPILEENAPVNTRRNISINIEDGASKVDSDNHLGSQSIVDHQSRGDAYNHPPVPQQPVMAAIIPRESSQPNGKGQRLKKFNKYGLLVNSKKNQKLYQNENLISEELNRINQELKSGPDLAERSPNKTWDQQPSFEDKSFIRIHDNYQSVENFMAQIKHERTKSRQSSMEHAEAIGKESRTKTEKRMGSRKKGSNVADLRQKMQQINKGKRIKIQRQEPIQIQDQKSVISSDGNASVESLGPILIQKMDTSASPKTGMQTGRFKGRIMPQIPVQRETSHQPNKANVSTINVTPISHKKTLKMEKSGSRSKLSQQKTVVPDDRDYNDTYNMFKIEALANNKVDVVYKSPPRKSSLQHTEHLKLQSARELAKFRDQIGLMEEQIRMNDTNKSLRINGVVQLSQKQCTQSSETSYEKRQKEFVNTYLKSFSRKNPTGDISSSMSRLKQPSKDFDHRDITAYDIEEYFNKYQVNHISQYSKKIPLTKRRNNLKNCAERQWLEQGIKNREMILHDDGIGTILKDGVHCIEITDQQTQRNVLSSYQHNSSLRNLSPIRLDKGLNRAGTQLSTLMINPSQKHIGPLRRETSLGFISQKSNKVHQALIDIPSVQELPVQEISIASRALQPIKRSLNSSSLTKDNVTNDQVNLGKHYKFKLDHIATIDQSKGFSEASTPRQPSYESVREIQQLMNGNQHEQSQVHVKPTIINLNLNVQINQNININLKNPIAKTEKFEFNKVSHPWIQQEVDQISSFFKKYSKVMNGPVRKRLVFEQDTLCVFYASQILQYSSNNSIFVDVEIYRLIRTKITQKMFCIVFDKDVKVMKKFVNVSGLALDAIFFGKVDVEGIRAKFQETYPKVSIDIKVVELDNTRNRHLYKKLLRPYSEAQVIEEPVIEDNKTLEIYQELLERNRPIKRGITDYLEQRSRYDYHAQSTKFQTSIRDPERFLILRSHTQNFVELCKIKQWAKASQHQKASIIEWLSERTLHLKDLSPYRSQLSLAQEEWTPKMEPKGLRESGVLKPILESPLVIEGTSQIMRTPQSILSRSTPGTIRKVIIRQSQQAASTSKSQNKIQNFSQYVKSSNTVKNSNMLFNFNFTQQNDPKLKTSPSIDGIKQPSKVYQNSKFMLNTPDRQMGEKMQLLGKKAMRALTNKNIMRLIGEDSAVSLGNTTTNKLLESDQNEYDPVRSSRKIEVFQDAAFGIGEEPEDEQYVTYSRQSEFDKSV